MPGMTTMTISERLPLLHFLIYLN